MNVLTVILGTFLALLLLYCVLCILHAQILHFWHFLERKDHEHDYMKLLRTGKDVEILVHDQEKIFGIPIVECLHQKDMRRHVKQRSYNEKITYVNPVLKLVDDKVILVGGIVHTVNKPERRISAETYLHYYDLPKPGLYRFDAKQGKYILVH